MRTLSLDLRERILVSYDHQEGTRDEVADRYRVSLGMVKKLLQQRRRTGDIGPRHHYSGRKPMILASHHRQMQAMLGQKPDLTLRELRAAVALDCTLPAIHYALKKLGLTYKKRHSGPVSKTARTSRGRVGAGAGVKAASTPPA
jgi:transposase